MNDCNQGCDDSCSHKWEIEPHPYSKDFDVFVTDDDQEARRAVIAAAEQAWDQCGAGIVCTVRIRRALSAGR